MGQYTSFDFSQVWLIHTIIKLLHKLFRPDFYFLRFIESSAYISNKLVIVYICSLLIAA